MRFLFCDRNKDFLEDMRHAWKQSTSARVRDLTVSFYHGNVQDIKGRQYGFVSPANSFGFMDGGIDYAYSREMFPGVEQALKKRIRQGGYRSTLDRDYLPIGSALLIDLDGIAHEGRHKHCALIASPTMWLPQSVSNTRNAYVAFFTVLSLLDRYNTSQHTRYPVHTLVCPALCTGVGKMPVARAAQQMVEALEDFYERQVSDAQSDGDGQDDAAIWREPKDIVDDQPKNYMNTKVAGLGTII